MTRAWLNHNSVRSDTVPWGPRLRLAVELPGNCLLYIAEDGTHHVFNLNERISMSEHWIPLHEEG